VTVYRFRFVKKHLVIARDICASVVALTLVRINQLGLGEKAVTSTVSFVSRFNYRECVHPETIQLLTSS
jgi:hypothetical protein